MRLLGDAFRGKEEGGLGSPELSELKGTLVVDQVKPTPCQFGEGFSAESSVSHFLSPWTSIAWAWTMNIVSQKLGLFLDKIHSGSEKT